MLQGHLQLALVAAAIAAAGFLANFFLNEKLKQPIDGAIRFLGLPLAAGLPGISLAIVLALSGTVACFWQPTFFTFFPGINIAFELGGLCVIMVRYIQASRSKSSN